LAPEAAFAREVLATALLDDGQERAAKQEVEALLARDPGNAQGHAVLAFAALKRFGKTKAPQGAEKETILTHLRAARDGRPSDPALVLPIAELFNRFGLSGEAATTLKTLRRARPDSLGALFAAARSTINVCDWDDYDTLRQSVFDQVDAAIASNAIDDESLRLLSALGADYGQAMRVAKHLAARYETDRRASMPPRAERQRLRIGYLQAQTKFHSTMVVIHGLVENHDRGRFEVYGYSRHDRDEGAPDAFQPNYRAAFDAFRDLSALDDDAAAQAIADDDIDILIELNGPGAENNFGVVARRPARLIMHYYGHAYGTGAISIDYLLVDPIYMPRPDAALSPEAPIYLPPSFMAAMPGRSSGKPFSRKDLGLPEDGFVLANFNHPWKFEPRAFGVWCRILKAVPKSVLWVAAWNDAAPDNLRTSLTAAGLDPRRLVVAPTAAHDDHLARLTLADLALDPFYVAGGVTTYDALRAGLPVVAHSGAAPTPSARMGASIVSAAGLSELVATSDEGYEAIVLDFAKNPDRLRALRADLPRRASVALDIGHSTRLIERAYDKAWRRWLDGLVPGEIVVSIET